MPLKSIFKFSYISFFLGLLALYPPHQTHAATPTSPLNILILDDYPTMGTLLKTIFESFENVHVTFYLEPKKAFEALRHIPSDHFQLVISDYVFNSGERGNRVLEHFIQEMALRPKKIILLTGAFPDDIDSKNIQMICKQFHIAFEIKKKDATIVPWATALAEELITPCESALHTKHKFSE